MSGGGRPSQPHSEDDLLEQWDFLDAMVDRQAASLRAGIQDSEEVDHAPPPAADPAVQLRVAELEAQLAMIQEAVEKAERERDAAIAQVSAISGENEDLRRRLATARPEGEEVLTAEQAEVLRTHADDVEALARRLRAEIESQRTAFRDRVRLLEEQDAAMRAAYDRQVEALRAAHAEILALQRQLQDARQAMGARRHRWGRGGDQGR